MQLVKCSTYEAVSRTVAEEIVRLVKDKPHAVLGLATGSTPIGLYQELIRFHRDEGVDFSRVTTFNLDEYYGLAPDHPQSYHYFMQKQLFDHLNIPEQNRHIPDGRPKDVEAFCQSYERLIEKAGGIDLQVLGIGENGHIGFNEPAGELQPGTHLVQLAEATIEANARFFNSRDEVPRQAITMGMRTILQAKRIVLLATGEKKASIVKKLMRSGITTQIPASLLRLHANVQIYADSEAAKLL